MNALLCGAGHNIRKILARIRVLLCLLIGDAKAAIHGLIAQIETLRLLQPAPLAA